MATPSAANAPSSERRGATRPPTSAPSTATAAGSQSRMESVIRSGLGSSRGDQEVEEDGGAAEQQQRGVVAQEAGLDRAHRGGAGAHDRRRAADERPVDDDALERAAREVPERGERADDQQVDRLVEEPLVDEQLVRGLEARAPDGGAARVDDPHAMRDGDAGDAEHGADDQADRDEAV